MNIDARNLNSQTSQYMRNQGFTESAIKVDDGGWERNGLLYLIEQKTERESFVPQSSWWRFDKDNLLGQRDIIRNYYRSSNRFTFHQNKWMIAIAQLRKGVLGLQRMGRNYRAIFSVPSAEICNFQGGFQRYHLDNRLNTNSRGMAVNLNIWPAHYSYLDQRGINIEVKVLEINQENYFGPI
jgi:hypothetical protein